MSFTTPDLCDDFQEAFRSLTRVLTALVAGIFLVAKLSLLNAMKIIPEFGSRCSVTVTVKCWLLMAAVP